MELLFDRQRHAGIERQEKGLADPSDSRRRRKPVLSIVARREEDKAPPNNRGES